MKIYNKKVFASGVFMAALGLLNLITSIMRQDLEINTILLIVVLFVLGFGSVMRSISRRMAAEDKVEELDERNRLIALKSKSKSFRLTQILSFILMLGNGEGIRLRRISCDGSGTGICLYHFHVRRSFYLYVL